MKPSIGRKRTGMQTINQWLTANGVDSSSFNFSNSTASAVSATGKAVVGQLATTINLSCLSGTIVLSCVYPPYVTIGPVGGNIPICASTGSVNTGSGWITSGSSGNGTVSFTVAGNGTTSVRIGTLSIDGQLFTILQGTTSQQAKIGVFRNGSWYLDLIGQQYMEWLWA